jgi:hypothetical protein
MLLKGNVLKQSKSVAASLLLLIAFGGCQKTETSKTPVARLDNQTLALEDIRAHIDTSREPSPVQVQQYIQRWLTEESLYREATERGLDKSETLNEKVEDMRRQLAINALLENEIYSQQSTTSTSDEIRTYYNVHQKEFSLTHDVALVSYAAFKNRDAATEFRNKVLGGTSWYSAIRMQNTFLVLRADSSYQTQATLAPIELWRVASNATNHDPSFPISVNNGHYVVVV